MRFVSCLFPATLATGLALSALSTQVLSQQVGSGHTIAAVALPEAPRPQFAISEVAPLGKQQGLTGQDSNPSTQDSATQGSSNSLPPSPQTGNVSGTVTDTNGDVVPGATVVFEGSTSTDSRRVVTNDNGFFDLGDLKSDTPYRITINVKGFVSWSSPTFSVKPGQFMSLTDIKLHIEGEVTSVTVSSSSVEIATEQVKLEEQQRVFGIIPNFYVSYESNPAPLTTKLKFQLAFKVSVDPITFIGAGFMAGIQQAADTPDYGQGAKGYGQRMGAVYADGLTDILVGGAILPSLLHQDPRYFYQGTGTSKSRAFHALSSPFICKGDNGQWQPNYSTIGGDLASAAIANAYYPESNRGAGMVLSNVLIGTSERMVSDLVQEFIVRKFTPKAKNRD